MSDKQAPQFLIDLLTARSPSGAEFEAQAVVDRYVKDAADVYERDALGNRIAIINPENDPTLLLAGHMDELALMITYVDKDGFLYFDNVGGIDVNTISGRRVSILTKNGVVPGVTGRRAIHLLTQEERKKVPEQHNLWIDIGAKNREEALKRVRIGDVAVYSVGYEPIYGSVIAGRACDNKAGCYVVLEVLRRLAQEKASLAAKVVSVATVQEEIGVRGAHVVAERYKAHYSIAVDVSHATDHPECDNRRFGEFKLGGGPIITRGPNVNPLVFDRLLEVAEQEKIKVQIEADPRPTPTDGRELQMGAGGSACAVISIPLRYMHTASELIDTEDVEKVIQLICAYARSLKQGERGDF
ncbi:MAG: M20/M25/M40 family metallo-hydrolase [Verrucomicrobiota bacterium JB022]|nr:M20/M25/M40 family metallo-hydrolase [Verrucomicrobiota bacterium JB022]